MSPHPPPAFQGPSLRDWFALALGVGFVIMGLVLLPSKRDVGIVTLAFFGACTAVFVSTIFRKLRFLKLRPLHAAIVGGVPIRPSRTRVLGLGSGVFFLGVILVLFGRNYGLVFWRLSWFITLVGAIVLLAVITRRIPIGYLTFDPEGITFGQKGWAYVVPWEQIARTAAWEFHDNPALCLWLYRPDAVRAIPEKCHSKMLKHFATTEAWMGAPVVFLTSHYDLDLPVLICEIDRYVAEPKARALLRRQRLN